MASEKINADNLSEESRRVIELIKGKKNFLLSGGAGSGKTYSLVEVLKAVISSSPSLNIACITYTNAAANEIESRIYYEKLHVSTIHDFLWGCIKSFQQEIKDTLIEIINDPAESKIKHPDGETVAQNYFDGVRLIKYKEYVKISKGIISHDEVIVLASKMFEKYEKLCSITKDKYPFIFVDEYQDTDPLVVDILLEHLEKSKKSNVIGFFGDAMQSIYEGSIGNLDVYIRGEQPRVIEIVKSQNRRNPMQVIELANRLRVDGLRQEPSCDITAPNIDEEGRVKQGVVQFLYSVSDNLEPVRQYLGWDFDNSELVKELNLTHNLIADKAQFPELMRIYDKDKILEYVKKKVKSQLERDDPTYDSSKKTVGEVIKHLGNPSPTSAQRTYIEAYSQYFELAKAQLFDQFSRLYVDKEQLLDDKKNYVGDPSKPGSNRDDLIRHLFKIESCIRLYKSKKFNQFIKATDYSINSVTDKIRLSSAISSFNVHEGLTIGEVIETADRLGLVIKDDKLTRYIADKYYLYKQVCDVKYQEFRNVFQYLEGYSPFSTQHKTKGTEFNNVLVILDNGNWNKYNFTYMFERAGNQSVRERSEKIFYVCCTRAKERLAVFFPNPSAQVIQTAVSWFGEGNVVNLDY